MSRTHTSEGLSLAVELLMGTPRARRTLARLLWSAFALVAIALAALPWQQSVTGSGRVVAFAPAQRQQEVDAPIEGRVTRWFVHEGSVVKQGDALFEISDNDPAILMRLREEREATIARKDAAVARVNSVISRAKALSTSRGAAIHAAEQRVAMSQQRTAALRRALEAAEAGEITAKLNIERQKALTSQGLASVRTQELAQLDAVRATTEVARAIAALQGALGEELALQSDRVRVEHDVTASIDDTKANEATSRAEEANAAAELARLEVRLARQSTMSVKAQLDGVVLRMRGGQGSEFVKSGDPIITLVPDTSERAVELWIDGNDMPLVSAGREVRLQFEGWPAVQFTGWPSVAVGTFGGTVSLVDAADDGAGRFRLLVTPGEGGAWPSAVYLRQGVRVNGWVLLDQVRLGREAWRRFNGFPPTVKPIAAGAAETKAKP